MPRRLVVLVLLLSVCAAAQSWDFPSHAAESFSKAADNKLKITVEQRGRYESRGGNNFGADIDYETGLERWRFGLTYTPAKWIKLSGLAQDARAPWYGKNAPNTLRDHTDLQEGYVELFPGTKGFGLSVGRQMLNYGETRLIGAPQWHPLARTYDAARAYYRLPKARLEFLFVSVVKIRATEFNRPVLGDRIWGTYNVFPDVYKKHAMDLYLLRHDQNRPGGFTGIGTLQTNTAGFRLYGPIANGFRYSVEAALQRGYVGPAEHRGGAWFASILRPFTIANRALNVSVEYKYASGTPNPADTTRTNTFDALSPAAHDKLGHADLFGWRNLHNARSLTSYAVSKSFTLNFMYDNFWLAHVKDGIYNTGGRAIARSAAGTAGRHVGQEADLYGVYRYKHFTFGGGYGRFVQGEFIHNATRGVSPHYLYIFHTYSL